MSRIDDLLLTVVLPAPNGCNLKCPFCAIAQRGEATVSKLTDDHYLRFIKEAATHLPVSTFSVQGYEPLLPETWKLTKSVLGLADTLDLGTRLVTNGVLLAERAQELSGLVDILAVSLDSNIPAVHEKLRGVPGCYEQTLAGIREARRWFGSELTVASVLFPNRERQLMGMPKLLAQLAVEEWEIGLYTDFRTQKNSMSDAWIKATLLRLIAEGEKYGVHVALSDVFKTRKTKNFYREVAVYALEQEGYLVRLSPDGTCSRGREVLGTSQGAPIWDTTEPAHKFLARILTEIGHSI